MKNHNYSVLDMNSFEAAFQLFSVFFFFFFKFQLMFFLKLKGGKKLTAETNSTLTEDLIGKGWKLKDWIDKIQIYRTEMKNCET